MMRISLLAFGVLASTSAFAGNETYSTTNDVEFTGDIQLFRGAETSLRLPASGAWGIGFTVDTDMDLSMNMTADSELSWEDGDAMLTHQWQGQPSGGNLTLDTDVDIAVFVQGELFGQTLTYSYSLVSYQWSGGDKFDSLVLPSGGFTPEATVDITETVLYGLEETFNITQDIEVTLGGDLLPLATATMTGTSVATNGVEATERNQYVDIEIPTENDGLMDMEALYTANIDAYFGITFKPYVEACYGSSCLTINQFEFDFDIYQDEGVVFTSDLTEYEADLPSIVAGARTLDLGTLTVGDSKTVDVTISDIGAIELDGIATFSGDSSISLTDDEFYATLSTPSTITVSFAPTAAGTATGTITLFSNDPTTPELTIPVIGVGKDATTGPGTDPDVTPGTDPGTGEDPTTGPGGDQLGAAQGCACNSTPTGSTIGWFGLALLGLLVRRRS